MAAKRFEIPIRKPCQEFIDAYNAMGEHLNIYRAQMPESFGYLRTEPIPPLLDHLSFKLGNQIFFVYLDLLDASIEPVSNLDAMIDFAKKANAVPCVMQMVRHGIGWQPVNSGWGLVDARNGKPLDPAELVTDELFEMSDWELHDFAVQVVRNWLTEIEGVNVTSYCSNPGLDPSIWFTDMESQEESYVVVRSVRHPELEASPPDDPDGLIEFCAFRTRKAFFASVGVANGDDPFDPNAIANGNYLPLYRGGGMKVRYQGLVPLQQTGKQ